MVEYTFNFNNVFSSLANETRRDMLARVAKKRLSVGEIARPYKLTFAAVSKHLKVLEKAKLVVKQRRGKEQMVSAYPNTLAAAAKYIDSFEKLWQDRLDNLDKYLKSIKTRNRPGKSGLKRAKG